MPKLLVFVPCERTVIGAEGDNTASIIAIIQGFTFQGDVPRAGDEKQGVTAIPVSWSLFALWEGDPGEGQLEFKTQLFSPHGRMLFEVVGGWQFQPGKRFHRLTSKVPAFPLDGVGDYTLRHSLKVAGGDFVEHASFPIPVTSTEAEPG